MNNDSKPSVGVFFFFFFSYSEEKKVRVNAYKLLPFSIGMKVWNIIEFDNWRGRLESWKFPGLAKGKNLDLDQIHHKNSTHCLDGKKKWRREIWERKKKKKIHRVVDMREKKIKWCWRKHFLWTCGFAINPNWAKERRWWGDVEIFSDFYVIKLLMHP